MKNDKLAKLLFKDFILLEPMDITWEELRDAINRGVKMVYDYPAQNLLFNEPQNSYAVTRRIKSILEKTL